jgi:subtilisin family serine protease
MPIKIYNSTGNGSTSAMLVNAYNYVRMMKLRGVNIRVTNNSYGGCDEACDFDQATKDGIDAMGEAGILNVFAAGNSGANSDLTPHYPSSYTSPSVLSVASSTSTDAKSGFSNFGLISVDLAAPGSGIYSSTNGSNTSYGSMSGTSMATPHVAGAAALLLALEPSLSTASLKATLMNNVDQLAVWNGVVKTGGRLNAFAALQNQTQCSFDSGTGVMNVPTKGGIFTVNVKAGTNCDYFVQSSSNWIHLLSENLLSGPAEITFRVSVNPTIQRTGSISIGGNTFNIVQKRN